jgi:MFS family permease
MAILGGLSASYGELFASRIFLGIGEAALVPAGFSIIADYFPPQRRGKPIAIFMGASALGVGLGTLGGGLILKALAAYPDFHLPGLGTLAPWRALFCLTALPGLLGVVALLTLEEPVRHAAGAPQAAGAARGGFLAFVRGARGALTPVYAGSALTTLAFYALVAWSVTLFVRHYHLGIPAAGLVVGAFYPAIQDVAPNAFRGQSVAIMLFGNNLIGATLGPTLVALATDGLFHDPDRLATSLAIVIIPALVAAAVIVRSGYAEFGRAQRAVT